MAQRVYIDGHAGTTGLRIREWLGVRDDLELVTPAEAVRKDPEARRRQLLDCDLAILCLPDDAAREAVGWAEGSDTRILDTSTAHRVADDWVYGLPELAAGQRDAIRGARRVSNPGCYASGFVLATRPLIDAGLLAPGAALSLHALSGYSGGGRSMIEKWESPASELAHLPYAAPYALEAVHKHVPEMMRYSGITTQPQFLPAVGPFRCGMRIQIPLHAGLLAGIAVNVLFASWPELRPFAIHAGAYGLAANLLALVSVSYLTPRGGGSHDEFLEVARKQGGAQDRL